MKKLFFLFLISCTPAQVASVAVAISADTCQIAQKLDPADSGSGADIALVCQLVGDATKTANVVIDSGLWQEMLAKKAMKK